MNNILIKNIPFKQENTFMMYHHIHTKTAFFITGQYNVWPNAACAQI